MFGRSGHLIFLGLLAGQLGQAVPVVDTTTTTSNANMGVCRGLMGRALCCEGSFAGLVHTGCVAAFPPPGTVVDFVKQCEAEVKTAECCSFNLVCTFFFFWPITFFFFSPSSLLIHTCLII